MIGIAHLCFLGIRVGAVLLVSAIVALQATADPASDPATGFDADKSWVAAGPDDHFVITVIDEKHIVGDGPFWAANSKGRQIVRLGGTLVWKIGANELVGKPKHDRLVMEISGVPNPRKVVFTRADPLIIRQTLARLKVIRAGVRHVIRKRTATPEVIAMGQIGYPAELKQHGIAGSVTVMIEISAIGVVRDVKVIESSRSEFEEPVVAAFRHAIYTPGIRDGYYVNSRLSQPIAFHPDGAGSAVDIGPAEPVGP